MQGDTGRAPGLQDAGCRMWDEGCRMPNRCRQAQLPAGTRHVPPTPSSSIANGSIVLRELWSAYVGQAGRAGSTVREVLKMNKGPPFCLHPTP